jgi:magnesium transporter
MIKNKKDRLDQETVDGLWLRLAGATDENKQKLLNEKGINLDLVADIEDDEEYIYIPLRVMALDAEGRILRRSLMIILGDDEVITVQDAEYFPPFEMAIKHIRRHPGSLRDSKTLLCILLHVLNEHAGKVITLVGGALEQSSDDIAKITESLDTGVEDIGEVMIDLNEKEELISRCLESQLLLARAARRLDAEVSERDVELQWFVKSLREDINGVKEHAAFEHDTVRYLQNAILASLNVKQNQIVKVFTIITAVFLPPTLIATFYGMNFTIMPELSWHHGFAMSIGLTLIAAFLPLFYIKYKGWLR